MGRKWMNNRCLYCYENLDSTENDYHTKCSRKFFGSDVPPKIDFGLKDIDVLAVKVLGKSISVTGVQPKLSLDLKKEKSEKSRLTIVGLWGDYILKPPYDKYPEMPENEDLTMHLAQLLKLNTAEHSLIKLKSGELAYISKRFDRTKTAKLHVEDMAQLTEVLTERKYYSSMEKVGKAVKKYSDYSGNDVLRLFELTLFCYLTGNADMHLKNFSLLRNEENEIILAPAYDLLATKLLIPEDKEEIALPINGKKNNLRKSDFDIIAARLEIKNVVAENVYNKVSSSLNLMASFVDKSFLKEETRNNYKGLIVSRADNLFKK
jgi:serine/threonine-protein kinase HipA